MYQNLCGFFVVLALICVGIDARILLNAEGGGGGDKSTTVASGGETEATEAAGPKPKCSNEGQLCGRIQFGKGVAFAKVWLKAGFYVDCCDGFDCDRKFKIDQQDGGICKKKAADGIKCVGHHMPCGTVNGQSLKCCDNIGLKCDEIGKYSLNVSPIIDISAGICKQSEEEKSCMPLGLPCGTAGSWKLDCCNGINCDKGALKISKGSVDFGFCKHDGARNAEEGEVYDKNDGSTAAPAPPSGPSGGADVKPGQIAIIIISLAWFFA